MKQNRISGLGVLFAIKLLTASVRIFTRQNVALVGPYLARA